MSVCVQEARIIGNNGRISWRILAGCVKLNPMPPRNSLLPSRRRGRFRVRPLLVRPRLVTCAALLGLGWAAPALAGERPFYEDAVKRVQEQFLFIDEVDPNVALIRAAESAEEALPWLLVEEDENGVLLLNGERGPVGRVAAVDGGLNALVDALVSLEDQLTAAASALDDDGKPYGIPDTIDLPVEILRGAARALDRHSVVLSGDRLERFDERISGRLQGIGARVGRLGENLVIDQVFPGGPAELAAVQTNDRLIRIDGQSVLGMSVSDAVDRIRGDEGTQVTLELERDSPEGPETFVFVLTRAEVSIPNVIWEVEPEGTGYIQITHFSEQTARLMRQALSDFQVAGVRGILIDLRDNSGGSMIQSCQAADLFLEEGPVLRTAGRNGEPVARLIQKYQSTATSDEPQVPVAVLVGRGSASASEILAGALVLRDRAVLVGDRTHGKGTVQKLYTLDRAEGRERARFKLTVARYLLPDDVPVETGVGIMPDLEMDAVQFDPWQVVVPDADIDGAPRLVWVDEKPGWREGTTTAARGDYQRDIARKIVLAAVSAHRTDLLAAIDTIQDEESRREEQLLIDTFRYRGIDWRGTDEHDIQSELTARVEVVDDPVAGDLVEIRVLVENEGPAPLHRVWTQLSTDDPTLPWNGLTLPIGYLPPGETGMGRAIVRIDDDEPDRRDRVSITVHAWERDPSDGHASLVDIHSRPPPPVRTLARILPGPTEKDLVLEATFENLGARTLEDVRLRIGLQKSGPAELAVRHVDGTSIAPGERQVIRYPLKAPDGRPLGAVPLQLRLEAARWGRVATVPVELVVGAPAVTREAPEIEGQVPVELAAGHRRFTFTVTDDVALADITAWVDGEKVAWTSPQGSSATFEVPMQLLPDSHRLVVRAIDTDGLRYTRSWSIRGTDGAGDAVVEETTEP